MEWIWITRWIIPNFRDSKLFWVYLKNKHRENIDNPLIRIYINEIENRITIKIKTRYHLELCTPKIRKLFGSTEKKITKDKNVENVPHLKITEVLLAHCNIINNDHWQNSRVLIVFNSI